VIDTGMGRMGMPEKDAPDVLKEIARLPNVHIHSVSTHLPVSNEDAIFTRNELDRFASLMGQFRAEVPGDYQSHALPSAGVLAFADPSFDFVRAGIMLYGVSPLTEFQKDLRPALTWKTRIGLVRDMPKGSSISYGRTFVTPKPMRVATLTAGYADGYPRHLSNRDGAVLVQGKRCPILGRVTMDLMMIDVTGLENAQAGDEVVLMGRQGDEEIPCAELAELANTISWEITTRIAARVQRVFV
jgi:alanine racemase